MSKKTDLIPRLIDEVKLRHKLPKPLKKPLSLVETGLLCMLMRHMTQSQAESSLNNLKKVYEDLNEARVSQVQEIIAALKLPAKISTYKAQTGVAMDLKEYLQEVFQKTHGLDLEFLREDVAAGGKLIAQMPVLGLTAGSYLLWMASGDDVPVHQALMRFLDKLELITRTSSVKKAQAMIAPLVPKGNSLEFTLTFHEMLDRWTDTAKPVFAEFAAVRELPFGKKSFQEWEAQVARAEIQRKKEEERRIATEKREAEMKAREEERERKRLAKEEEAARKKAEVARKKVEAAKKKAAAAKKAAADREAAKKAAVKQAAAKKAAAKKAAAKKAAAKKAAAKKAAAKKAAAKKAAAKKATAKKAAAKKKPAAKKPAAKKAPAKKPSTKKPSSKKAAKKAETKSTKKKPAAKKKAAKKKTTKKTTRRR